MSRRNGHCRGRALLLLLVVVSSLSCLGLGFRMSVVRVIATEEIRKWREMELLTERRISEGSWREEEERARPSLLLEARRST